MRYLRLKFEITFSDGSLPKLAFGVSVVLLAMGAVFYGIQVSVDTQWFVKNGLYLWRWLLDPDAESLDYDKFQQMRAYVVPSLLLGGAELLPSAISSGFIVGVQILMYSVVVSICFQIWQLDGQRSRPQLLFLLGGLFITFGLVDVPIWTFWLLTDITFLLWMALFVWALVLSITSGCRVCWAGSLILSILALIVRPTGVCLPFIWAATAMFWVSYRRAGRSLLPLVILLIVPVALAVFVVPLMFLVDQNGHPFPAWFEKSVVGQAFSQASDLAGRGTVVANRDDTTFYSPSAYFDYVSIVLSRLYYHYVPFRHDHSMAHQITNIIYFPTALMLAAYGLKYLLQRNEQMVGVAAIIIISSVYLGLFHGITLLAFSWRYQVPATFCLWLAAGFGMKYILGKANQPLRSAVGGHHPIGRALRDRVRNGQDG